MAKIQFDGKILILGFGSITLGTLPLLIEKIDIKVSDIRIVSKDTLHKSVADSYGIEYLEIEITKQNYYDILVEKSQLSKGDFLINLSVGISSKDLMKLCHEIGCLYIDTCIEPWEGFYDNDKLSNSQRSNYALRHEMLEEKEKVSGGPTAVIGHGANPGLVSHFVKRALIEISQLKSSDKPPNIPQTQQEWAQLAKDLGVKVIQISERDTQRAIVPKQRNEFVNTWSIDGFISEGVHQPSELGFGTHEKEIPAGGNEHEFGCKSAIYLSQPGGSVKVRGWTPLEDIYHGFLITHNESISIASYLTLKDEKEDVSYRPTVYYCYHPCDGAVLSIHEIFGREKKDQTVKRLLMSEDIQDGTDELGVLLLGDFGLDFTGYWHGSRLSIEDARKTPHNNATSLQVTATVLAGVIWAIKNPNKGLVEADEIDFQQILEITDPYTEEIISTTTNWTPEGRKDFQINDFFAKY